MRAAGLIGLVLLLGGCSRQAGQAPAEPHRLSLRVEKDQRFEFVAKLLPEGAEEALELAIRTHVESAGTTVTFRTEYLGASRAGEALPAFEETFGRVSIVDVFDAQGRPQRNRTVGGLQGAKDRSSGSAFAMVSYPEHEVRPGDSWEGTLTRAGRALPATITFEEVQELENGRAAVLQAQPKDQDVSGLVGAARFWVDLETGVPLQVEEKLRLPEDKTALYKLTRAEPTEPAATTGP